MQYPNNMRPKRGNKPDFEKSITQFEFPEIRQGNLLIAWYFDRQGKEVTVRYLSGKL